MYLNKLLKPQKNPTIFNATAFEDKSLFQDLTLEHKIHNRNI
ncbi:hypothetical protein EV03_0738 [Prochlorococcus marinus str. PAC1]|uniref:Uncharacterized protein n=1 Tax=Prochlorococcus marinus str. PAC1 TaxID=59924 RepID=A0A0A2C5G8_PROMR|nr:hypothetical protein EV03_0738 [Prochlorococcus marinus str. PAC1]